METAVKQGRLILSLFPMLLCSVSLMAAGETLRIRPPAVPLVCHDPYFSIWSQADQLTDCPTTHWTGKPHPLNSVIRIDGQLFRVMGIEPAGTSALPQVDVQVLPTRTIYRFGNSAVNLVLTFLTPALPSDLDVLARPVSYVTWEIASSDGKPHDVQVDFGCSGLLAVDAPGQEVVWDRPQVDGLLVTRVGAKKQRILARRGDDLRIEWGYAYLAAPAESRSRIIEDGVLRFDLGRVTNQPVSCHAMLAYDDLYSIQYFEERLRPYWRRKGWEAADLLKAAAKDYALLNNRCLAFDKSLMADLTKAGGEKYAVLCTLAYRQTFAGNKLAADTNGMPMLFPKENFSNGCISTVDILYPQAPFFLTLSPALTKAMLVPVLDYAASPKWPYGYAPHDVGTYPFATGQVYGMGPNEGDGARMPLEESGNMLIMMAALAKAEGNAGFAQRYWPLLTRWADYCVKEGLDPQNQLCSADMFGHMPRSSNLALKAIIGIGGYAQLCELLGKPQQASTYWVVARDYAAKWQTLSKGEGRTLLAYGQPDTWALKHNLIWDRVLGTNLFPEEVGNMEIAWYLKVQNKYGLPVDNRTDMALIDWTMWSIALARDSGDFETLLAPIFRYVNETPTRVPLSDWYVTTTGQKAGFQARPVVGGIFIKLLADATSWNQWSKQAQKVSGQWAPPKITIFGPTRELVPTARKEPVMWRYTLESPGEGWMKPDFDDSTWKQAPAGFGTAGTPGAVVRTEWKSNQIWIRRAFTLADEKLNAPCLVACYDEDAAVYLNGVLAAELPGWTSAYEQFPIQAEALAALRAGRNVMAVYCQQTYGGQSIDVGLSVAAESSRWSAEKAWQWYRQNPWRCGFNYVPANAISYTEMWMDYSFDENRIEQELALAEKTGFNCLRVVLPFVVWQHEPEAFKKRFETFVAISARHGLKVMPCFFDDCVFGEIIDPVYGKQPEVVEGWYANGWTPSPGHSRVRDLSVRPELEKYVKDILNAYKEDTRILCWDLYNEPTNSGIGDASLSLVRDVFEWARQVGPIQPLTTGLYNDNKSLNTMILELSDIMSFHCYEPADVLKQKITELKSSGRPVICTEWLNRGRGSVVHECLPVFQAEDVGCLHWGLVNGKTQTHLPWGHRPGDPAPKLWQHDLYHGNYTPYNTGELEQFQKAIQSSRKAK